MTVDKNLLFWSLKECSILNYVNGTEQEVQWLEVIMNKILLVIKVFAMTN